MKLRFAADQAYAFRMGIDVPRSINVISVDPSTLDEPTRILIGSRLNGIDVGPLRDAAFITTPGERKLIVAKLPTLEALIEACKADENGATP